MHWTIPEYVDVLTANLQQYLSSKQEARCDVVENTVAHIKAIAEKLHKELPPDVQKVFLSVIVSPNKLTLFQKIDTWFQNHRPKEQGKKSQQIAGDGRCSTIWTLRRVVQKLMPDEIHALVTSKAPNLSKGTKDYLALYPSCWTEVVLGISAERKLEFENLAEKWNEEGIDETLRPK
jgi:cell wall assembly regulator SMI1